LVFTGLCLTFRAADCDTDYYLLVEKVREKLAVSKQKCTDFIPRGQSKEIKRCRG
jgi:hypothetical protein